MEYLKLAAHQKDLGFSLSSWETLDLFDYDVMRTQVLMEYDPETREIRLNKRGIYKFEFKSQLLTDTEEMIYIKFRLNIDGVAHALEHQKNTGVDQEFTQLVSVEDTAVILIEVNATP